MSLSHDQVNHFKNHGYTAVPDFFNSREVRAIQAEVERFKREGLVRNVATEGDGETPSSTKVNLQLIPLHEQKRPSSALCLLTKKSPLPSHNSSARPSSCT